MTTMADVAKHAGVSLSTVSYVLSGKRAISEETRRRVLQAIEDADYHPNQLGRALATQRTRTIALLFPTLARDMGDMHLEFVASAANTAQQAGYAFLISISPDQDAEVVHLARRGFTDGLILMEIKVRDPRVDLLRERGYPFTMIGHTEDNRGLSFVDLDFETAVRDGLRHLADLGHREVALLRGAPELDAAGFGPSIRSQLGFERGLAEYSLTGTSHTSEASHEAGYALMRDILATQPGCTALIAVTHRPIAGMLRALRDCGHVVPETFSVLGVISPHVATSLTPALSTLDFPAAEMGHLGAELLIHQLEGGEVEPVQHLLTARLTIRESTGPVRQPAFA